MKKKKRGKKRENFLKEQYSKSWSYLKSSREFIYSAILIFFIFAVMGFLFPVPEQIKEQIMNMIQELLEKTKGMSGLELTNYIFWNNLQSSFFGMVFGVFFGAFSIIVALVNGYVLGFVGKMVVAEAGFFSLWTLFPHGIFELPAIFISLGLGLKIGSFIFQKKKIYSFKNYFWSSLRVFIFIVIPLLIAAAIIEGSLIALLGG